MCVGLLMSLPIRLLALLETIIFLIGLPFQILIYAISLVIGLLTGIVLLVTLPCSFDLCIKNFTNRTLCASGFIVFITSIVSLFWLIAYTILIPFQLLIPELCVFVFKYHKWGTYKFAYF